MADVDEMSEPERMRYLAKLAAESWCTPNEGVEVVDINEAEDKQTATVTLRKRG